MLIVRLFVSGSRSTQFVLNIHQECAQTDQKFENTDPRSVPEFWPELCKVLLVQVKHIRKADGIPVGPSVCQYIHVCLSKRLSFCI